MPEHETVKPLNVLMQERQQQQRQAVLVRVDDAMLRLERLASALEKAADEVDRQLAIVKGRI